MAENGDDTRVLRWGIMGTGQIASDMVQILKQLPGTEVAAVGSRSQAGADRFGDRWGITTRHSSYEALAGDESLDIVYIATPSLRHPQDSRLCLEAGKAVLCEKTMAPNAEAAAEVLELAKSKNMLFLHAVWSRFFPAMQTLKEIIDSGKIGDVRSATASFCQADGAGSCSALLETGIYCAQFLQWCLGERATVRGAARVDDPETGMDVHVSALLEFDEGRLGNFECSLGHTSDRIAKVYGTEGVIEVSYPFWCPTEIKVTRMTGCGSQQWSEPEIHTFPLPAGVEALPVCNPSGDAPEVPGFNFVNSQGLTYEAMEVDRCFRAGLTESPKFSSSACLSILEIITEIDAVSRRA
uniref:D-xylose 1-dehydrogenase (NADP(+), D-xylono-1,5-lactone-forming) n=1 Tax=Phaeomonas parva TaxID=124430 RepID=A0A6U4L2C4_9STRA|mmetsp:Transcript_4945/g.13993  ORF Transcript_4945/g.13993 Transcript_4945/m.13993 type:complete len:354 (+) Transcript_4945:113-1174(+)|eukprot:CAMPEP_0118855280 /NCGR_PEP_ID=MMETSP1163-20130328/3172_1 /TAXON_ID=124430 /ORGANISM="Phaeomonas parva, Strain CCMP2877" /LENGTH=353 /DNA_ID=CAMNT_0006788151 /DNA_START=242 /DNA_END=1303 /DNA_ORIENTATION=+